MKWAALLVLGGCASAHAPMGGSRTLPRGDWQVAAAAVYTPAESPILGARTGASGNAELVVRYGVRDWLDVGARAFTAGGGADVRCQLYVSSEEESPRISALLALTVGARTADVCFCGGKDCRCPAVITPYAEVIVPAGFRVAWFEGILGPVVEVEQPSIVVARVGANVSLLVHLPHGFAFGPQVTALQPLLFGARAPVKDAGPSVHLSLLGAKTF